MSALSGLVGGKLGQMVSGGNQKKRSNGQEYERILKETDFFTGTTNTLSSGKYHQLGVYSIPPQLEAELGQGDQSLDPMEQGRPYFEVQNGSAAVQPGFLKLTHENSTGNDKNTVVERRSEEFNQSTRSERIVMPKATTKSGISKQGEDDAFGLYFKPDSDTNVDASNSTGQIPATFYE